RTGGGGCGRGGRGHRRGGPPAQHGRQRVAADREGSGVRGCPGSEVVSRRRGGRPRGRAPDDQVRSTPDREQRATPRQAAGTLTSRRGRGRADPRVLPDEARSGVVTDGHEVRTPGPGTGEVGRAGRHVSPSTSRVSETPHVRHAPRRGRGLAVVITVLIVLLGGAAVVGAFLLSAPSATPSPVEFEVMPGWAGQRVADELHDVGLVRSATAFEYYLRFRDLDHSIGEGLYDLDPTMSARQVAEALVAGGRPRVA